MTYNELCARTENLAKGMVALGKGIGLMQCSHLDTHPKPRALHPKPTGVEPESRVVIYAETQRDWMVSAYAAWQLNCKARILGSRV